MAQPPPRPAAPRQGGPSSAGPASSSGARPKEGDKQSGTFFLGRYRVVDEIGVGGMASVHLARMDGPGGFQKWVAIKRIHPHLVEDDQFVDMFLDEARIAAGINHANVAQVFDLGKDDNTYWIAMEYLHGEPLREIMRRKEEQSGVIAPELAARICSDAAEGLHAAHELRGKNGQLLGLVHRDVTPHNLFVTYDGYTKVVDFGIAKVADRLSSTRAGTLKGKLAYMSPEQVRGAEVDRTTDIFALGVVLWELTTNQRLFRMDTDLDTLEKVQACMVQPPSTLVPGYPLELEAVVMRALAKRKQDRYPTARELSRALQAFVVRRGALVGSEEVGTFVRQLFIDRIQKRDEHLAWAAEVTSTINVDTLRGKPGKGGDEISEISVEPDPPDARDARAGARPPSTSGVAASGAAFLPAGGAPAASGRDYGASAAHAEALRANAHAAPPPSSSGALQQMTADSLMDDDDDVPTTVATRDHIESGMVPAWNAHAELPTGAPRPAAGMPAAGLQQVGQAGAYGTVPGAFGAPAAPRLLPDEHTAALPVGEGLGSTVAMQSPLAAGADRGPGSMAQPSVVVGQGPAFGLPPPAAGGPASSHAPGFGAFGPPAGVGFNGQPQAGPSSVPTFGAPPASGGIMRASFPGVGPPAPTFGPPPPQVQLRTESFGPPSASFGVPPQQLGVGGMASAHLPQSQIETSLSLPRPDAAALWLAQQEATGQRSVRRNTGALLAVFVLTVLCVVGIGTLLYFKLKAPAGLGVAPEAPAPAESGAVAAGAQPAAAPEAPAEQAAVAAAPVETGAAGAAAGAPSAAVTTTGAGVAGVVAGGTAPAGAPEDRTGRPSASPGAATGTGVGASPPGATTAFAPGGEEPGYLTIVCNPFCDDVQDQGKSLGPSPVVRLAVKPGQHRITLKRAGVPQKVISVIVVSGQVTAQRVSMK